MQRRFKVGDKVQTKQSWGSSYLYGIVVEVNSHVVTSEWILKSDGSSYPAKYHPNTLYLIENKKVGLCEFLRKVQKEYAQ